MLTAGPFGLGVPEILILFFFMLPMLVLVVLPAWIICGKLGWSPPLGLLALLPLVGFIFLIMLTWEALPHAGATRWLMLLLLFPLLGLIMLFWLAFSEWKMPVAPAGTVSAEG